MAKTIKEKAKEYDKVIKVINDHESIVDTSYRQYFELGANYVLDEIMDCFPGTICINPNEVINDIADRIRELKGQTQKREWTISQKTNSYGKDHQ